MPRSASSNKTPPTPGGRWAPPAVPRLEPAAPGGGEARRHRLLDAALATFLRYGFRKTSMEEVARAGKLSRQALYLHFSTKEQLFGAAVRHFLVTGLEAASVPLRDAALAPEAQLGAAFDAWVGRYIGLIGADVADLEAAGEELVGPLIAEYEGEFLERVSKAIRSSRLASAYRPAGLSPRQLAETLQATARGLKHACHSRAEFGERFASALRALCWPLHEQSRRLP